jgi:hypothetical protein
MTNSSIKLPVMAFLAIYLGLLAVGVSHAGTITDNFSGATINTRLWRPFTVNQHQRVTQQGGELLIQIDQNSSGLGAVEAKFLLKGDFDVTVDYRLVTQLTTNNGVRLGIEGNVASGPVQDFEARRYSLRPDDPYPGGKDFYQAGFTNSDPVQVATTDGQGSLRVTRVGSVFACYYKHNGVWTPIHSKTGSGDWARIMLDAASGDGNTPPVQNIQVAFSNFQVIYDQVKYLSCPSPVTMLLLD